MSVWSDAFDAAFTGASPSYAAVAQAVEDRCGRTVTEAWLAARMDEAMGYVWLYAPCRRSDWLTPADLPRPAQAVLGAMLSRSATNPDGIRTIQAGEFSQTWAGSSAGLESMFTPDEKRLIAALAGCTRGRSTRATVDPPIPGYAGVTQALEDSRPQPWEVRDGR